MTSRARTIAIGLAALAAVTIGLWLARGGAARGRPAPPAREAADREAASAEPTRARAAAPEPPAPPSRGGSAAERRARWQALLGAVRTAQERRVAATRGTRQGAPSDDADAIGTLDPETIRKGIQGMKELLAECYELARRDAPGLAGRLVVEFTLIGEPTVGAVVEDSTVDAESELGSNPVLAECVRETIMTLELEAPPHGGRVHVRYPFVFSEGPP